MSHHITSLQQIDDTLPKKPSFFKKAPNIKDMPSYKTIATIHIQDMEPFIDSKNYKLAHNEADYWEDKVFPNGFSKLEKLFNHIPKTELLGANNEKAELFVSEKVPIQYRKEVCYHEWVESLARKILSKK